MLFVLVMAFLAGVLKLQEYYSAGNWLLVSLDIIVLVVCVLVMFEAWTVIKQHKQIELSVNESTK
jgi:carbon starvation protein